MTCSLNAGTKSDPTGVAGDLEDESLCILAYSGASITLFSMFVLSILLVRFRLLCVVAGVRCWLVYSACVTVGCVTVFLAQLQAARGPAFHTVMHTYSKTDYRAFCMQCECLERHGIAQTC